MEVQVDVVIMGAGIAGSSAAIQLAEKGHDVLLLDRQQFPRHKTCGEFMSPETKEMLSYLGVDPKSHGIEPKIVNKAKIILPSGKEMEARFPGSAWGISRYDLDHMLHLKALESGAKVKTKVNVINIIGQEDHSYVIKTKQNGQYITYHAKALIGAFGVQKPQAARLTEERDHTALKKPEVFVGVKSHYTEIESSDDVSLYFCDGGYVGISPVQEGVVNVAALLSLDTVQNAGKSVEQILSYAASSNPSLYHRLTSGTPVKHTKASISPVILSTAPRPWSDFPHIGDAMLMIPPLCGDGMSIALRSSMICSGLTDKYLSGQYTYAEWKEGYVSASVHEFTNLLRRARLIQKIAFSKANKMVPILGRMFPWLPSYLVRSTRLSEIGLTRSF